MSTSTPDDDPRQDLDAVVHERCARSTSAPAAPRPGQSLHTHAPAGGRVGELGPSAAAAGMQLNGAYNGLRAAMANLRRSRHPEAHEAAVELAAEGKAFLDELARRAREADPDHRRRERRDQARRRRTEAQLAEAMRRRGLTPPDDEDGSR